LPWGSAWWTRAPRWPQYEIMSMVRATVQIRTSLDDSDALPSLERIDEAAKILEKLGVRVVRKGRRSVSVEATPEKLLEVFGISAAQAGVHNIKTAGSAEADLFQSVEIPSDPLLFRS